MCLVAVQPAAELILLSPGAQKVCRGLVAFELSVLQRCQPAMSPGVFVFFSEKESEDAATSADMRVEETLDA